MSTTSLFVEIVVTSAGALAWMVLLVLIVLGWNWVPTERGVLFSAVGSVTFTDLHFRSAAV